MPDGEQELVRWLQTSAPIHQPWTRLGVGDDMAILNTGGGDVLITTDMLLDGIHFATARHDLALIGRKAIACSLSDCAAMACRPIAATASVALPRVMSMKEARQLVLGMRQLADRFECELVGGDTTRWDHPLCLDICMLATPWPGVTPVRRSDARPGDRLFVTGPLGGSLQGRHLSFTPRVHEARQIAQTLGGALHAMMDISDGVSLDLARLCQSSKTGARLVESELIRVIHADAHTASHESGRTPLDHALNDGEDFELLVAVAASDPPAPAKRFDTDALGLLPIGSVTADEDGRIEILDADDRSRPLEPRGYDHFHG